MLQAARPVVDGSRLVKTRLAFMLDHTQVTSTKLTKGNQACVCVWNFFLFQLLVDDCFFLSSAEDVELKAEDEVDEIEVIGGMND